MRTNSECNKTTSDAPVHAALHCIKSLTTNKYAKDHRSQEQWTCLLQSALAKIIDLAKTGIYNYDRITNFLYNKKYLTNFKNVSRKR